jgi:hypothetical protein
VFLGAEPGAEDGLPRVRAFLERPGNSDVGVIWVDDPGAEIDAARAAMLRLGPERVPKGSLATPAAVALRNYALAFPAGCELRVEDDGRLVLTGDAVVTVSGASLPIVQAAAGERAPTVAVDVAEGGRLRCRLSLRGGGARPDLDALDAGLRFYFLEDGAPRSLRYPVFDGATAAPALDVVLDVFAPLDPGRTFLAFTGPPAPLACFYRTLEGHVLTLAPEPGSGLAFAVRADQPPQPGEPAPLTLAPAGSFTLGPEPAASTTRWLRCGLSGAECFSTSARTTLTFVPLMPALAGDGPDAPLAVETPAGETPSLETLTSWVALSAAQELAYLAQPDGAGFHVPDERRPGILAFRNVCALHVPAMVKVCVPMPPYAGVDAADRDAAAQVRKLEVRALAPARRAAVARAGASAVQAGTARPARDPGTSDAPAELRAVTPQGFVATFRGDAWSSLTIARHVHRGDQERDQLVAFRGVDDPLRAALLASEQFVVISDPEAIRTFTADAIDLEDWTIDLDPARWREHGTIALIKNCRRPLRDLVGELSAWAEASALNRSPPETQARLREILADADRCLAERRTEVTPLRASAAEVGRDRAPEEDSCYRHFVRDVVDDPAWNGVLFLDVAVRAENPPPELRAILAAAAPGGLRAHHLGVSKTPVTGAPPVMGESALFGLIRHREEPAAPGGPAPQRLQLLDLEVLFRASKVQSFTSRLALTLNELFGSPARRSGPEGNTFTLVGSYQRRSAGDTRPAFKLVRQERTTFELAGPALREVEIDRAELTPRADGADGAPSAAFALSGSLSFATLQGPDRRSVDLLSYERLAFSNLVLTCALPPDPSGQAFSLDVTGVRFDESQSTARPGSLAGHFPATPTGMIASSGASSSPGALGYMTVRTRRFETAALGSTWFALVFDLCLGKAGELAASVGLVAKLALAWSPRSEGGPPPVAVGLKLPGSSGTSTTIGIQGVIALGMRSLELVHAGGFQLRLNNVTLTFLKKKLPPSGSFDLYLFGDPHAPPGTRTLGWYGAYGKDKPPSKEKEKGSGSGASPQEPSPASPASP